MTPVTFPTDRGILGLCYRCGAGLTATDAEAGSCTQCGADCRLRPPCPLCGGKTERVSGTVEEPVITHGSLRVRRVGRPAVWDQCLTCEWAEERPRL